MHSRHDLVWLNGAGWQAALAVAAPTDSAALRDWARHDWPVVVTRRAADVDPADGAIVCLGMALPPEGADATKRRIALRAQASDIATSKPAMTLEAASATAPVHWLPALRSLCARARGLDLRVYGSLALQTLTGRAYVRTQSDIDVLFAPRNRDELDAGLRALQQHATDLPLDGEIVFPDGAAVAWKEWLLALAAAGTTRVLVKDQVSVRLASPASLLAVFDA